MINLTFSLTAQIPSGKNAVKITRTGHRYPDKRFKEWRDAALEEIEPQIEGSIKDVNWPVTMIVDYVPADARRRDLPGMCDALCHLLEKANILADDKWVYQLNWKTFAPDKKNAGCRITVMG